MSNFPYSDALHPIRDGCHAWLEPPGTWGMSNSGVVAADGEILVIDTRNDVPRARALRAATTGISDSARVTTVINTHADGDHWYGNLLFGEARIVATEAAAAGMHQGEIDPRRLADVGVPGSALHRWAQWRAGTYDYAGWEPVYPTETFTGSTSIRVGGTQVEVIQVGPAHTAGDAIVHVPSAGVVYAGDIVFNESTPIVWSGPVSGYIDACNVILQLDCDVIVPGHGPIADPARVRRMRDYLSHLLEHATAQFQAGRPPEEAYRRFDRREYAEWPHGSRAYQSILTVYDELDPRREREGRIAAMEVVLADDGWLNT